MAGFPCRPPARRLVGARRLAGEGRAARPLHVATLALPLVLLAAAPWLLAAPLLAQEPAQPLGSVPLSGVVLDSVTAAPVAGAVVSLEERGRVTLAGENGRFTFQDVAAGPASLVVRSLGYRDARVTVAVGERADPVVVRLSPDPLALEGIDVVAGRGRSRGTLGGVVRSAATDSALAGALVSLPYQGRRKAATDEDGVFRIPDASLGPQLVWAEQLGYHDLLLPLLMSGDQASLELRLTPDSLLLQGIREMAGRFRSRGRAVGIVSRSLDMAELAASRWGTVHQTLQSEGLLTILPCTRSSDLSLCVAGRMGRVTEPEVYIDELPAIGGLDQLASYPLDRLYGIEVYGRGRYIRAYTRAFVERTGRRPEALLPICWACQD